LRADILERFEGWWRIRDVKKIGWNRWTRGAAAGGLGALVALGACGAAFAQAGPGPIRPAPGTQGDSTGAPRAAVDEPKPPERKDLWGTWKLDIAQSDDAMEQIKQARTTGAVGSPRNGGGGGNGNPNSTGIHMGGSQNPFPGGNGSAPRKSGSADDDFNHQQMQELTNPAGTITLSALDTKEDKGAEVDYTDDLGRKRAFYTDGRKITKSSDDKFQEYNSHWEDYRLVSEVEGAHDARASRSFEPAPGGDKLIEMVRLERTKSHDMVEIRYVYEKVPGSSPKQATSAAGAGTVLRPTDPAPASSSSSSSSSSQSDAPPSLKSADAPPTLKSPGGPPVLRPTDPAPPLKPTDPPAKPAGSSSSPSSSSSSSDDSPQ
jgi:hypothetical protein